MDKNQYARTYRMRPGVHEKDLERQRAAGKKRAIARKQAVLELLGGSCKCCGITNFEFLSVDHINGGGYEHRKTVPSWKLYNRLIKGEEDASKYRLLCMNCNFALGKYGRCPHQEIT